MYIWLEGQASTAAMNRALQEMSWPLYREGRRPAPHRAVHWCWGLGDRGQRGRCPSQSFRSATVLFEPLWGHLACASIRAIGAIRGQISREAGERPTDSADTKVVSPPLSPLSKGILCS